MCSSATRSGRSRPSPTSATWSRASSPAVAAPGWGTSGTTPCRRSGSTGRRAVLRRVRRLVVVLFAVTLLTFLSLNLLGDPLKSILGPLYADPVVREGARRDLRLDDPIPTRYVRWLGDALHGDLGRSYNTRESVSSILGK